MVTDKWFRSQRGPEDKELKGEKSTGLIKKNTNFLGQIRDSVESGGKGLTIGDWATERASATFPTSDVYYRRSISNFPVVVLSSPAAWKWSAIG